jgi:hypothetical protein
MSLKRTVKLLLLALILLPLAGGIYLVWDNNREVVFPDKQEYRDSLERSIQWMMVHRDHLLQDNDPVLWWMVKESAHIVQDPRLLELFAEYKRARLDPDPHYIWGGLYDQYHFIRIDPANISHLPDYNQHLIYGLTCSRLLEQEEIIQRQLSVNFCDEYHPISPACVTHQMMGFRFMQRNQCGDAEVVEASVAGLQDKVVNQLTWDPRLVDVYLQRVLMLVDSGAMSRVKPVWIQNILDAQLEDGGWGSFDPLVPVGGGSYFGFTEHGAGIKPLQSNFHTAVQGVLLMAYLVHGDNTP